MRQMPPQLRFALAPLLASVLLLPRQLPAVEASVGIHNPELFAKSLEATSQALKHFGELEDRDQLRRTAAIGYRLARESNFSRFPISFFLVDMQEPNAFALPGGQVFVTKGMLELGLSDDELAALLAHEIAHVTLEHGIKMQRRATLLNVLSQAVLVGVIVGTEGSDRSQPSAPPDRYGRTTQDTQRGDMIQGTAAAGLVLSELLMRDYSREFEDQADEEGQRLAAAAGFSPEGTKQLMATLDSRLPESRKLGYWRTHPFSEDRVQAAAARGGYFKVQPARSAASYRAATQAVLLDYMRGLPPDSELAPLLKGASLTAWPQGEKAEELRLERVRTLRKAELEKALLSRDYGALLATYRTERNEVEALTPESAFLETLDGDIRRLSDELEALYPNALEVLRKGVFETSFLESFLSNYPDSEAIPEAALALATSYSRLGRQTDAVERYLQAWEAQPDGPVGREALQGLRTLAPTLDRLAALERLCGEIEDDEFQRRTSARLEQLVTSYSGLDNGAEYLERFPEGAHVEPVSQRMEELAEKMYGEVVLYQAVGDSLKALKRIQDILTYAPFSDAAERLRERAVLQG